MGQKKKSVQFKVIKPQYAVGGSIIPEEVLWESGVLKKKEDSNFEFLDIDAPFCLKNLCGGDKKRVIKFVVQNKKGQEMATIQTDLSEIARAVNENKQPFKTADEKNETELEFVKYNRS